jgi:two-component system chemotaxis sensor kinase CheA
MDEGDPLDLYAIDPEVLGVLTEYEEHRLRACIREGLDLYRLRAAFELTAIDDSIEALRETAQTDAEIITYLPSMESGDQDSIELIVLLASRVSMQDLQLRFGSLYGTVEPVPLRAKMPTAHPNPAVPTAESKSIPVNGDERPGRSSLRSVANSVRVDIRKLDYLMNVVGELALVRSSVNRVIDRMKTESSYRQSAAELDRLGRGFERHLAELRTGILDVRMVPLGQVFNKLGRIVRQAARDGDKKVRLVVAGADTEVDKLIVEELTDPLMHLVRNAIDHGIEGPTARQQAGKNPQGTLALNAYQKGSNVVIEVEDDGRGMSPHQLRDIAVRRGLLTEEAGQELSSQEMLNLVFLPGLSSSHEVTDMSGRGVGMDVVKTNIVGLGGLINVASELGTGTKVTVTLPITLAIIRALLVNVASRVYALPITVVREVIPFERDRTRMIDGREVITLRGETLAICDLRRRFGFSQASGDKQFVIVASMGKRELGFVVDGLDGQEDVIIKSLGKSLSSVRGFAGATDIGEKRVALVIDAPTLFSEYFDGPGKPRVAEARA